MSTLQQTCEAIVLRVRPYEETHVIASFLSPTLGKFSGFARGARRSIKRFGALLQPGQSVVAYLHEPRAAKNSTLYRLDKLDPKHSLFGIRDRSERLNACFFALSLMDSTLPEGPVDAEIYDNFLLFMESLNQGEGKVRFAWLKVMFWLKNAHMMGYGSLENILQDELATLRKVFRRELGEQVKFDYQSFQNIEEKSLPELSPRDFDRLAFQWRQITGNEWKHEKHFH